MDVVNPDDCVERAVLSHVSELDALDVVGNGAGLLGNRRHLIGRDIDELRLRIDEAADQPGTGDAVDLRMLARHPLVRIADDAPRWQLLFGPAVNTAFE